MGRDQLRAAARVLSAHPRAPRRPTRSLPSRANSRCSAATAHHRAGLRLPRPTLVARKLRTLELRADAPQRQPSAARPASTAKRRAAQERQLAEHAELAYRRLIADWKVAAPTRVRAPHRGAHHKGRQATKQRGRHQPQNLRFSSRSPAPPTTIPNREEIVHAPLTFMRRSINAMAEASSTLQDAASVDRARAAGLRPRIRFFGVPTRA